MKKCFHLTEGISLEQQTSFPRFQYFYPLGLQKKLTKKGTLKKMKVAMGKSGMRGMTELTGSENIAVELKTLEAYLLRLKKEG